jgi:DNA-binding MarR family transcriptional regulator
MDFFDALVRYETDLWNHLNKTLTERGEVSLAQLDALRVVHRHAGSARVQEISRDLSITVGAASKLVDRLEETGLAARSAHPTDRRSALIGLTDRGVGVHDSALAVVGHALDQHLAGDAVDRITALLADLRGRLAPQAEAVSA